MTAKQRISATAAVEVAWFGNFLFVKRRNVKKLFKSRLENHFAIDFQAFCINVESMYELAEHSSKRQVMQGLVLMLVVNFLAHHYLRAAMKMSDLAESVLKTLANK